MPAIGRWQMKNYPPIQNAWQMMFVATLFETHWWNINITRSY